MDNRFKVIALNQFKPILGEPKKNLKKHVEYIEKAIENKAHLIIFPELSITGYNVRDLAVELAISSDNDFFKPLFELSRKIDILFGFIELGEDSLVYNSSMYLSDEKIVDVYRKIKLPNFGIFEEKRFFKPGNSIKSFKTQFGNGGVLICRDFLHPSLAYVHFSKGTEYLFSLSNSPLRGLSGNDIGSQAMWEDAGKCYSRFFSMYVFYVNRVGFEDGLGFPGGSFVAEPGGKIVFKAPYFEEGNFYVKIYPEKLKSYRKIYAYYRDEDFKFIKEEIDA